MIQEHQNCTPAPSLSRAPTFRLQTVRLLTTRLQQFVSTTISLHYSSSPLLFVSTTFRLHYYSSPHNSSPYYLSPTTRLHYYSSPLLFVSTTFRLHKICLQQFISTTIRLNCYSDQLQFYYI